MSRTGGRRPPASAPAGGPAPGTPDVALAPAASALAACLLALAVGVEGSHVAGAAPPDDAGRPLRSGLAAVEGGGAAGYLDGPPPGHTGGFEEPTCRACHFDRPLNPGSGEVRLEGVPDRWAADSVYRLRVVLAHPEMRRAGFQLSARWRDGRRTGCSAGRLEPETGRTEAVTASDSSAVDGGCRVLYVQHTEQGTGPVEDGAARWSVRWRAPGGAAEDAGPVVFHVAANAANDDASEFGDRIYAAEARSRPAE